MDIHRKITEYIDHGCSFAVALILKAEGSTPRKAGVKAVIDESGRIWGTVGGGAVEKETLRRATEACKSKRPVVFDFSLEGIAAEDAAPICGGTMRILLDPTAAKDRAAYAQAAEAVSERRRGALITTVRTVALPGESVLGEPAETETTDVAVTVQWVPEEVIPPEPGFPGAQAIGSCLARETPQLFVDESLESHARIEVFVEPVLPRPILLIVGGGHIGQALAHQAILIGFDITVIDDRPEYTAASLFPEAVRRRCGDIAKELAAFPFTNDTYVVIVTRGHQHDAEALAACIHAPVAYVGMIGSKHKVALIRRNFIESGLTTEESFNRVFTPIGLDIGAVTVPEIATSIAAQLIAVRRKAGPYTPPGDMRLR